MNSSKLSHDIQNLIERLRIMHDLIKAQNFSVVSKEELQKDLKETLQEMEKKFNTLLDQ